MFHVKHLYTKLVVNTKKQQNKKIGDLGERLACIYLEKMGYKVIERNYWRKWGEIDIVAKQGSVVHFCEVKTVSHETKTELESASVKGTWRPEEQVHEFKLRQIHKAVETWLADNNYQGEWQIDVIALRIVPSEKYSRVKIIENIT